MNHSTFSDRRLKPAHPFSPAADLSQFYVITTISNPWRYRRRYELYWPFAEMCRCAGVHLVTVELALGERPFMVTQSDNPYHVQLRTVEELWHKENMINIGCQHSMKLSPRPTKFAWIDADCRPAYSPRDWFEETWHLLQHYEFVQMWESMLDIDINNEAIGSSQPSFMSNYIKYGTPDPVEFAALRASYPYGPKGFGRPGLAWAANVDALYKAGGLVDFCILGSGDWYMAHALVGSLGTVSHIEEMQPYVRRLMQWQTLCERWIKRDVGFVNGLVIHDFHGRKALRQYMTRDQILISNQYNPDTDVKYDSQGLLQLETWEPRQIKLRDQIRAYFASRNEDSIDL
jgi:hypothetical protein